MSWLDSALETVKSKIKKYLPETNPIDAAKDFMSEAVAQRIREEACTRGYTLLAEAHRNVVVTIVWQNSLLLLSLLPVYFLHSAIPFYVAYAVVAGYSLYTIVKAWPWVRQLFKTRSITQTLSAEVLVAINTELTQRQYYERKAVEWLCADLKKIADDVARKLKPDVIAAATNMAITLLLAFVAFRLFVIPLLEQRALHP